MYSEGSWNGARVGVVVVFGLRVEASRLQCSVRDGLSIDQSIVLRHLGARAISDGHLRDVNALVKNRHAGQVVARRGTEIGKTSERVSPQSTSAHRRLLIS